MSGFVVIVWEKMFLTTISDIFCLGLILLLGCNQQNLVEEKNNMVTESSVSSKEDSEEREVDAEAIPIAEAMENTGVSNNENSGETLYSIERELSQHNTLEDSSGGK